MLDKDAHPSSATHLSVKKRETITAAASTPSISQILSKTLASGSKAKWTYAEISAAKRKVEANLAEKRVERRQIFLDAQKRLLQCSDVVSHLLSELGGAKKHVDDCIEAESAADRAAGHCHSLTAPMRATVTSAEAACVSLTDSLATANGRVDCEVPTLLQDTACDVECVAKNERICALTSIVDLRKHRTAAGDKHSQTECLSTEFVAQRAVVCDGLLHACLCEDKSLGSYWTEVLPFAVHCLARVLCDCFTRVQASDSSHSTARLSLKQLIDKVQATVSQCLLCEDTPAVEEKVDGKLSDDASEECAAIRCENDVKLVKLSQCVFAAFDSVNLDGFDLHKLATGLSLVCGASAVDESGNALDAVWRQLFAPSFEGALFLEIDAILSELSEEVTGNGDATHFRILSFADSVSFQSRLSALLSLDVRLSANLERSARIIEGLDKSKPLPAMTEWLSQTLLQSIADSHVLSDESTAVGSAENGGNERWQSALRCHKFEGYLQSKEKAAVSECSKRALANSIAAVSRLKRELIAAHCRQSAEALTGNLQLENDYALWQLYGSKRMRESMWALTAPRSESEEKTSERMAIPSRVSDSIDAFCFDASVLRQSMAAEVSGDWKRLLVAGLRDACLTCLRRAVAHLIAANDGAIDEHFALQLYFDLSFVSAAFGATADSSQPHSDAVSQWLCAVSAMRDAHVDAVSLYACDSALTQTVAARFGECSLLYQTSAVSSSLPSAATAPSTVFALSSAMKSMPRIELVPEASAADVRIKAIVAKSAVPRKSQSPVGAHSAAALSQALSDAATSMFANFGTSVFG